MYIYRHQHHHERHHHQHYLSITELSLVLKHFRAHSFLPRYRQKAVNNNSRIKIANAIEETRSNYFRTLHFPGRLFKIPKNSSYSCILIHIQQNVRYFHLRVVTRLNCSNLFWFCFVLFFISWNWQHKLKRDDLYASDICKSMLICIHSASFIATHTLSHSFVALVQIILYTNIYYVMIQAPLLKTFSNGNHDRVWMKCAHHTTFTVHMLHNYTQYINKNVRNNVRYTESTVRVKEIDRLTTY